jgi:hypothetical protein
MMRGEKAKTKGKQYHLDYTGSHLGQRAVAFLCSVEIIAEVPTRSCRAPHVKSLKVSPLCRASPRMRIHQRQ